MEFEQKKNNAIAPNTNSKSFFTLLFLIKPIIEIWPGDNSSYKLSLILPFSFPLLLGNDFRAQKYGVGVRVEFFL